MTTGNPIEAQFLGLISYSDAVELMHGLRDKRLVGSIPDQLLFLEHPPTITTGRQKAYADLNESPEMLKKKGIEIFEADRGGRLTYHGPGQLVVYFIVDLKQRGLSIQQLVWKAEEGMRLVLMDYGIAVQRDCKNPGLWIGKKKIASLGFHIHKDITTHGVALNINGDLTPFTYMTPCGVAGCEMTSVMQEARDKNPSLHKTAVQLLGYYRGIF